MLDKRLLWTGGALVIVAMTAVVAMALPVSTGESVQSQENISDVEIEQGGQTNEGAEIAPVYLLKEYQGRIGIFVGDAPEPEMVLDVMVKHLPEYDQQQLVHGIAATSYDALIALIEDFSS